MYLAERQKALLEELFNSSAVLVGDEVRARTGLNTPIYFDLRESVRTNPSLLRNVGREFALKIFELAGESAPPQCVVGVPDAATPLAAATVRYASEDASCCKIVGGRMEREDGNYRVLPLSRQMRWAGPKPAFKECNLIDDVVASGRTKRAAIAALHLVGIQVRRIIVLFDRQQGDDLRKEGYDLQGIFTASCAANYYLHRGFINKTDHSRITEFLLRRRFHAACVSQQ